MVGTKAPVSSGEKSSPDPARCRVIVVGTSSGGVEALAALVGGLPVDLPAAVFIVLHTAPYRDSILPDILNRRGPLPAAHAVDGETIRPGRIYVAPSDRHLMIQAGQVYVGRGPKENGHRPAVDPLFRTAARAYGPRVIGVILTGALDDGTAGLLTIKSCGGVAVVQDPHDALHADMPQSAIDRVKVDHVVPLAGVAPLLIRLAREPLNSDGGDAMAHQSEAEHPVPGRRSFITCPECNGSLTEMEEGGLLRFRCHVGHAYSQDSMLAAQAAALEAALWAAARSLEESAALAHRMAERSTGDLARRFEEKATAMEQHVTTITRILLQGDTITESGGKTA